LAITSIDESTRAIETHPMSESLSLLDSLSDDAVWRLEAACCRFEQSWQAGQRPRLEDALAGTEGAERLALLRELLLLEVHYRRRAGEGPAPDEYRTRFPDATALLGEVFAAAPEDGDRPRSLPGLDTIDDPERTGPELPPAAAEAAEPSGDAGPVRFRVLRFHAAGGLGEVFVAEDVELRREVALKEIKRQHAGRIDSRGRFVLEAEITGGLEHPGIVPVYGLGTYPDGRPYYAMRFIRGETLAAAIQRFHAQAPARFDVLEFRQLLGRFVAVCQAVAYAHSRGVLHRDLKPGNIMLGKFGETLVVDWGLAKVVGRPDAGEAAPGEEGLLRPSAGHGAQTVGVVGTPAFMSPEQATGTAEELGVATDVYSLGATLYALLTNRAPFRGPADQVVRQVESGAWVPARQVNPAVPAALDAICRKAMALRPGERYGSALALAEDLEHWLADEPVVAYREPAGARLRRWVRKHPRKVTAAAVLLLATVVGLGVGTILLQQAKQRAEANLHRARGAVQTLLENASAGSGLDDPGMRAMRLRMADAALEYYLELLDEHKEGEDKDDPELRVSQAEAYRQAAEVRGQLGMPGPAKTLATRAMRLSETLRQEKPNDARLRAGLARSYLVLADLELQTGDADAGTDHASRAIELVAPLHEEEKGELEWANLLGRGHELRATGEALRGEVGPAFEDNGEALNLLEHNAYLIRRESWQPLAPKISLAQGNPAGRHLGQISRESAETVLWLGRVQRHQRELLELLGWKKDALRESQRATDTWRRLAAVTVPPLDAPLRNGLALALVNAGHAEVELGRPGRGEPALRQALELTRQVVADYPLVPEYQDARVQAAGCLGEGLFARGQTAAAAECLREAVTVAEATLNRFKQGPPAMRNADPTGAPVTEGEDPSRFRPLHAHHARFLSLLGCLEGDSGHPDTGLLQCQQAQAEQDQLLRDTPEDRLLRSDWLSNREALARLRFLAGQTGAEARLAGQRQILDERRELAGRPPVSPRFQGEVGASAAVLAGLLLEAGRANEALAVVDEVLPAHQRLVQATPEEYELRRQSAELFARKAEALARTGQGPAAGEAARQAIAIAAALSREEPLSWCPPWSWPSVWPAIAGELCQQSRKERCYLYDLSRYLTLASTLPGNAGGSDPAGRAVQALRVAMAFGFDNVHKLRTDARLAPLRGRPDFEKLVRDPEARVGTKSP
jgi:tetratricopeptide (TPR) repeat protein